VQGRKASVVTAVFFNPICNSHSLSGFVNKVHVFSLTRLIKQWRRDEPKTLQHHYKFLNFPIKNFPQRKKVSVESGWEFGERKGFVLRWLE
jgi:hypothetical protein